MMKSKLIQIAILATAMAAMAAGQQNISPASQQTNTNGAAKKSGSSDNTKKPAAGNSAPAGTKGPAVTVSKSGPAKTAPAAAPPVKASGPSKVPVVVVNQSAKQPASPKKSSPATSGAKTSVTKSTVVQTPKPTVKPVNKSASGNNPASAAATPPEGAHGRRDPFVSVIRTQEGGTGPVLPPCSSGKKCLFIPQIVLQATIKDRDGKMIALVANGPRTYFLRENDQVFNGSVVRITMDSVIFRESVTDKLGHESSHEVVKRLTPAS
ncbi:MAG TPA: hypothetical protein VFK06_13500 [Candidatus Angelobacter sp.]|nr:hypothetical protein [Candidatus Angelobacter sp.]